MKTKYALSGMTFYVSPKRIRDYREQLYHDGEPDRCREALNFACYCKSLEIGSKWWTIRPAGWNPEGDCRYQVSFWNEHSEYWAWINREEADEILALLEQDDRAA